MEAQVRPVFRTVSCWGANNEGQVSAPRGQFTAVGGGLDYSRGLRTDGTIACWGPLRSMKSYVSIVLDAEHDSTMMQYQHNFTIQARPSAPAGT